MATDSYSKSRYPYTDIAHTMLALNKNYGQPQELVLQLIAEVMDGPDIGSIFEIHGAFTAEPLGLAEHTHPAMFLKKYRHLAGLPLQQLANVHTLLLIGSDCPYLIKPKNLIKAIRFGPPGSPAAVSTRFCWTLQVVQDLRDNLELTRWMSLHIASRKQ